MKSLFSNEYNLSPADKQKYGTMFNYINESTKEIRELEQKIKNTNEQCQVFHTEFLSLHKKVDTAHVQYTKLSNAINRLKTLISQTQDMQNEVQNVFDKLTLIESKLSGNQGTE